LAVDLKVASTTQDAEVLSDRPPLYFDEADSLRAHRAWKANCGPHALAAACALTLDEVREKLLKFPGWMNPTMIGHALESIGIQYRLTTRLRTRYLCDGISRIQWEGPWLSSFKESYRHTHWVAHRRGWVLCSAVDSSQWIPCEHWRKSLEQPWHVTHHYEFREVLRTVPVPGQQLLPLL
jgi:hypothetical protein